MVSIGYFSYKSKAIAGDDFKYFSDILMFITGSQLGGPVLSVFGHCSAQLFTSHGCSGRKRTLSGRHEGGRAAEDAHRESNVWNVQSIC